MLCFSPCGNQNYHFSCVVFQIFISLSPIKLIDTNYPSQLLNPQKKLFLYLINRYIISIHLDLLKIYKVMQILQNVLEFIEPYCEHLNAFIEHTTGYDIGLENYCSIENLQFELIFGGAAILLLIIAFLILGKKSKKNKVFFARLVEIKQISHDTKIFTFNLPQGDNQIGLNIGEHLQLQAEIDGQVVSRKYTPISRADVKRNSFQLLIKVYYKTPPQWPNGGLMSQYVNSLKLGDKIKVTLPFGRFNYLGKSQVQIKELDGKIRKQKVDHIFMIGGGTGITPLYQIIQYVTQAEQQKDRPKLTLLFANRTEDDILVKSQIQAFQQANPTFKYYFSIDRSVKEGWNGLTGFVNEEKIAKLVGQNKLENSLFVACGPPILCNIVQKCLQDNYKIRKEQFFRF